MLSHAGSQAGSASGHRHCPLLGPGRGGGQPLLKYFVQFRIEENLTDSERAQRNAIKID